jgi:sarcosine oxidase subunit gamma
VRRSDAVWVAEAVPERRFGLKGPRAAELLQQLQFAVPELANSWAPLRSSDGEGSWNVISRLGTSEFFIEESGAAPGIAALEELLASETAGVYPVLREDSAIVLGGACAIDALAQVCNVDFAALAPATRPVVMTLMIGVGVLVLPQLSDDDAMVYRIWCDPSFGPYLWTELEEVVNRMTRSNS